MAQKKNTGFTQDPNTNIHDKQVGIYSSDADIQQAKAVADMKDKANQKNEYAARKASYQASGASGQEKMKTKGGPKSKDAGAGQKKLAGVESSSVSGHMGTSDVMTFDGDRGGDIGPDASRRLAKEVSFDGPVMVHSMNMNDIGQISFNLATGGARTVSDAEGVTARSLLNDQKLFSALESVLGRGIEPVMGLKPAPAFVPAAPGPGGMRGGGRSFSSHGTGNNMNDIELLERRRKLLAMTLAPEPKGPTGEIFSQNSVTE